MFGNPNTDHPLTQQLVGLQGSMGRTKWKGSVKAWGAPRAQLAIMDGLMLQHFMANGTYLRAGVNFCFWVWGHTRQCSGLTPSSMLRLPPGSVLSAHSWLCSGGHMVGQKSSLVWSAVRKSPPHCALVPRGNEKGALRRSSEEMIGAERQLPQEGLSTPPPRCQLLTLTRWPPLAQVLPQAPRDCLLGPPSRCHS